MAMLKNRLSKLESKLGVNVTIEDVLRLIRFKDSLNPEERHRITSSSKYQQITNFLLDTIGRSK